MTEGSRQELSDDRGEHRLHQTLEMMLLGIAALLPQKCHVFNNNKKMQDKGKQLHQYSDSALGGSMKNSTHLFLLIIQMNFTNMLQLLECFFLNF